MRGSRRGAAPGMALILGGSVCLLVQPLTLDIDCLYGQCRGSVRGRAEQGERPSSGRGSSCWPAGGRGIGTGWRADVAARGAAPCLLSWWPSVELWP